ncbi:TBC1 domain family member 24-like protein [Leptotrombidium deliense]|uniref:TBC1 domain family member 24-like protein n=1 Tax=Leptotrombidium deliense TaxID=299467 RepID=A0A443SHJ5_9ACAR|nr:TBC1 domain family member 24-like protein [Leptotrombidium deliense]
MLNYYRKLWVTLSTIYKRGVSDQVSEDLTANDETLFAEPSSPRKLPCFADPSYCRFYNLNAAGQQNAEKVIWAIARDHPEITFSPLLYPLAALFLHFTDIKNTYTSLNHLLDAPSSGCHESNGQSLLPQTKTQLARDAYVLIKLTNQFGILPQRSEQRKKLKKDNEIDACFLDWLKWIFIGLPFEHIVRIMDCFLIEGTKFLFRTALALLLLYRKTFPTSNFIIGAGVDPGTNFNLTKMMAFCEKISLTPNELIKFSSQISRLRRTSIEVEYRKAETSLARPSTFASSVPPSPAKVDMICLDNFRVAQSSRVAPRTLRSDILNYALLDVLWDWLPEKVVVREPQIVFSTNEHGNSLSTFYLKTGDYEPTILLVKTESSEIFGAYCSSSWSTRLRSNEQSAVNHYFGTGETFLFTLKPKPAYYPWIGASDYANEMLSSNVPHSSQLFMAANSHMISVGAGNGIALWLDENLTNGSTQKCDTFNNKPLCSNETFTVLIIEVIAFE